MRTEYYSGYTDYKDQGVGMVKRREERMKQVSEVERIEFLFTFSIYSIIFTSVIWCGENRSVERKVEPLPIRYFIPFENVQVSLIQSIARKER